MNHEDFTRNLEERLREFLTKSLAKEFTYIELEMMNSFVDVKEVFIESFLQAIESES